jgi:chromatin remodeling complex protein RSC6
MAPSKKSTKTESATPVAEVAAPAVVEKTESKKKSESKKADTPKAEVAAPVEKTEKKKSESKKSEKKSESKKADTPKAAEPVAEEAATEEKGGRRQVTKESVDADFTALIAKISAEIERLQSSGDKVKGIKFLKSIKKVASTLHNDANRMMKLKKNSGRKAGYTSGFNTPTKISKDMAKFIGGDEKAQYNRVEITKKICAYIKEHNLQNPSDRRQILADEKLKNLLKLDAKTAEPLTYFRLQQYLTSHFISEPKPAAPAKN